MADPPPGDRPARRRRTRVAAAELPLDPVPVAGVSRPEPRRRAPRAVPREPDPTAPDLFTPRPEPVAPMPPPVIPDDPAPPSRPAGIPVQRVAPDTLLRGGGKADAYLYLVVDRREAGPLLRDGVWADPAEPPRLVEKPALPALLSALEEEGDGLAGAVVLRLRAAAAGNLLEPDPDRRGGWLLSGGL